MFNHITVDEALLSIRDAASQHDLAAMFALAEHVIQGIHTQPCGITAIKILNAILRRDDVRQHHAHVYRAFILASKARKLQYEQGHDSFQNAMGSACHFMQALIEIMVYLPRSQWNLEQLDYAVTWLKTYAPQLNDTETVH